MHGNLIESNTGGSPVIAGTHITVEAILRALAAGEPHDLSQPVRSIGAVMEIFS